MNRRLAVCAVLFAVSTSLSAQELGETVESRERYLESQSESSHAGQLAEYTRTALLNNAGLRAAFDRWSAHIERAPQVGALPDPMISFTYFVEEIETRTGPQDARLQLTQQIPWLAKLRRKAEIADAEAESLWWIVEAKILELRRDVAQIYAEYANLAQAVRILEQNVRLLQDLEPIVQRQIQTGAQQGDLLRLQVEIGKVDNALESHRERRASLSQRLHTLMNSEDGDLLPWPEPLSGATTDYHVDALRPLVVNNNPYMHSLAYRLDAADSRMDLAKASGRPDFNVGISYFPTGASVINPRPSDSGDDPVALTVGLTLPIGRAKYRAASREALALKSAALQDRTQLHHDLLWRLEQTLYDLNDAVRQVSLFRDTLIPRGRQSLELTEISYEAGNADLLDLIDSQRDLLDFELSYWKAVRDYHQRKADLIALCGGTLP